MYKKTMNPLPEQPSQPQQRALAAKAAKLPAVPPVFYKETQPAVSQKPPASIIRETDKKPADSKYRRVAKFLILIGSEQASEILAELDSAQVEEISKEIAYIRVIKPEERDEILSEFRSLFLNLGIGKHPYAYSGSSRGGVEAARRILYAAKGPEKGEEILNKAIPKTKENLFGFLEEFSAEQLVMLLKNETAQTTALILSRMTAKITAETLSKLPPGRKADILLRIARQHEVAPEVLEQVSAALKEKARHISSGSKDIEIDGMKALAAILKQSDYAFGDRLINQLEEENPEIGQNLKEKLYTLDDVIEAADRPIQDKLKTMTEREIAILIKGRNDDFYEKIMSCISAGRRQLIREESEILNAATAASSVTKREYDSAAREFLAWFRIAREKGEILLYSDEDVVV